MVIATVDCASARSTLPGLNASLIFLNEGDFKI